MSRRIIAVALVVGTFLSSGCGTCVNLVRPHDDARPYGGVRWDCEQISNLFDGEPCSGGPLSNANSTGGIALVIVALPFADLALSFVADTLTYPLAKWLDRRQCRSER